jgi:hypothetical protein
MMTLPFNARNPHFNRIGGIDCEIEHETYGWIPYSACEGPDENGSLMYAALLAGDFGPVAGVPPKTTAQITAEIAARRWYQQNLPLLWNGHVIALDGKSPEALDQSCMAVERGFRLDTDGWKCFDMATGQVVWRPTTNAELLELAELSYRYVQDCFAREGVLLAALAAGTYTDSMLNTGWPG